MITTVDGLPADEIISGERLQALADVTVTTESVARFHKSLPAEADLIRFPGDFQALALDDKGKLDRLRSARSIFVYTHLLPAFVNTILPHLDRPFVLLSHNSDVIITDAWRPLAEHRLIKHWFAQNAAFAHPKLECLPIGVANAQWPHGDMAVLADVMARPRPKRGFVYLNFKIETNPACRKPLHDFLSRLRYVTVAADKDYRAYLEEMADFRFCVSPPGNGIDCHRTWEALYLGVVPIVAAATSEPFRDMRLLTFSSIDDFHPDHLESAYRRIATLRFNVDKLRLSWWRGRVERAVAA